MKIFNIKILLFLSSVLLISSCLSSRRATLHIPENAAFVLKTNVLGVALKIMHAEHIFKEDMAKIMKDTLHSKHIFGKVAKSGINVIRAYTYGDITNKDSNYLAVALPMFSAKKFNRFIEPLIKDKPIQTDTNSLNPYQYMNFGKTMMIGWTDKVLITYLKNNSQSEEELKRNFERLILLKKEESLIKKNKNFRKLNNLWGEVTFWANVEKFTQSELAQSVLLSNSLTRTMSFKSHFWNGFLNFEDGKISIDSKYYFSSKHYKQYQSLYKGYIKKEVIFDAPVADPYAVIALGLNVSEIKKLLIEKQLIEQVEKAAKFTGLELDELLEMLSGDIILLLKDIKTGKDGKRKFDYAVGFGVKTQETLDKLLQVFFESGLLRKEGDGYVFFEELFLIEKGHTFYITNSQEIHQDFLNGASFKNEELSSLAQDNSVLFYTSKEFLQQLLNNTKHSNSIFSKIPIESIDMDMTKLEYDTFNGNVYINFDKKDENSLMILYHILKQELSKILNVKLN